MVWTSEEVELLKVLYPRYIAGRVTRIDMEDMFNRSCGSIRKKAEAHGLTGKQPFDNSSFVQFLLKKTGKRPKTNKEILKMVEEL